MCSCKEAFWAGILTAGTAELKLQLTRTATVSFCSSVLLSHKSALALPFEAAQFCAVSAASR